MHKVDVEQLREEVIPKIMGNQEESLRERRRSLEDQEIVGIVGN